MVLLLALELSSHYKAGRRTPPADLAALQAAGHPVIPLKRGGQLTWHGPGQLVLYPVCPTPPGQALATIRRTEDWGITLLAHYGVTAYRQAQWPGLWVGKGEHARKVASVGLRVSGGWTTHGLALNVSNTLAPFHACQPCGLPAETMTRLQDVLPAEVPCPTIATLAQEALLCAPFVPPVERPLFSVESSHNAESVLALLTNTLPQPLEEGLRQQLETHLLRAWWVTPTAMLP